MTMIMSLAMTAFFISPVFFLAGWIGRPAEAKIRNRFNGL